MARPRYAEMLVDRRRQLGLSISQASSVLRLKEQVLIAFEEGDFERIPKSGYAQGMLASYARYLGLNSRQVVNQFTADLYEYADSTGRNPRGYAEGTEAGPYVESHGLLPTSGGLAGDMGAFSTTSQPHSRSQATPLVNSRRYVGTAGRSEESAVDGALNDPYAYERAYQAHPTTSTRGSSQDRAAARAYDDGYDDVRYDDQVGPSSPTPPRQARSQSASSNTRRRAAASRSRQRTQRKPQKEGFAGILESLLSNSRNLVALGIAALALVLLIGGIFVVRSCSKKDSSTTGDSQTVPVTTTQETDKQGDAQKDATTKKEGEDDKTGTVPSDTQTDKEGEGTDTTGKKTDTTPKQTRVVVSVESGMVSWVDVQCDGESKIADTVTGPWSQTYEVHESIVIEVGDPAAVTVTENGVRKQFDTKTSGIGSITIQGTPVPEAEQTKKDDDEDKQDEKEKDSEKKSDDEEDEEDEYLYEYNGYDIYYNKKGDYYYFFDDEGRKINAADGTPIE